MKLKILLKENVKFFGVSKRIGKAKCGVEKKLSDKVDRLRSSNWTYREPYFANKAQGFMEHRQRIK